MASDWNQPTRSSGSSPSISWPIWFHAWSPDHWNACTRPRLSLCPGVATAIFVPSSPARATSFSGARRVAASPRASANGPARRREFPAPCPGPVASRRRRDSCYRRRRRDVTARPPAHHNSMHEAKPSHPPDCSSELRPRLGRVVVVKDPDLTRGLVVPGDARVAAGTWRADGDARTRGAERLRRINGSPRPTHGTSTWHPRRRRNPPPRNICVAPAAAAAAARRAFRAVAQSYGRHRRVAATSAAASARLRPRRRRDFGAASRDPVLL